MLCNCKDNGLDLILEFLNDWVKVWPQKSMSYKQTFLAYYFYYNE